MRPIFDTTYKGGKQVEKYTWALHHELVLFLQIRIFPLCTIEWDRRVHLGPDHVVNNGIKTFGFFPTSFFKSALVTYSIKSVFILPPLEAFLSDELNLSALNLQYIWLWPVQTMISYFQWLGMVFVIK